jgi:hypothetical protein
MSSSQDVEAKEQYSLDLIDLFVGDVVLVSSGCNNDNDNVNDVEPELAVVASIDTTTSYHNGDETEVCRSRRITLHPDNVRADFDSNGVSPSMQIIARCVSGNLLKFDGMGRPLLIVSSYDFVDESDDTNFDVTNCKDGFLLHDGKLSPVQAALLTGFCNKYKSRIELLDVDATFKAFNEECSASLETGKMLADMVITAVKQQDSSSEGEDSDSDQDEKGACKHSATPSTHCSPRRYPSIIHSPVRTPSNDSRQPVKKPRGGAAVDFTVGQLEMESETVAADTTADNDQGGTAVDVTAESLEMRSVATATTAGKGSTAVDIPLESLETGSIAATTATAVVNDQEFTETVDKFNSFSETPTDDNQLPNLYTPDEAARIAEIREVMESLYPIGDRSNTWSSLSALKEDMQRSVGDHFGFKVSTGGSAVSCTRRKAGKGYENHQQKRSAGLEDHQRRTRSSNRCDCEFIAKTGKITDESGNKRVYITAGSYMHTNGCRPCAQQLLNQNIAGGTYLAADSMREGLQTLLDMMRYQEYLESQTIRNVLKEKLPESVPTTAALIANVRVRLKKMLFSLQTEDDEKQRQRNILFKLTTEESNKLMDDAQADAEKGTLCSEELNNPDFVRIATEQLNVMLRESLSQEGNDLKQILSLLERAHMEDDGFDFRIGRDILGNVTAIVWQDGIMRGHCTRLLDVVMLDMMKRRQNSIDWPYCGPVLITGEKKIATACEAIMVTESIDAYVFVMNSVYEMSGVDRSVTKCIFADGIMSVSLLRKLGIEGTCNLILDRYHLVEVDWPKVFGWHYSHIKKLMKNMVESNSEDEFITIFEDIRRRCPNEKHQEYLEKEVFANRRHFVSFWTKSYTGHLDRLGNQGSESNHSSYCQRISYGAKVNPAEQLAQCLERSKDKAKELNAARYRYYTNAMASVANISSNSNRTEADVQHAHALTHLSSEGLKQWTECNAELPHYSLFDQDGSDAKLVVRNLDQMQPPRIVGPNQRCVECQRSKATMSLCVHELLYDGGKFSRARFTRRYAMLNLVEHVKRVSRGDESPLIEGNEPRHVVNQVPLSALGKESISVEVQAYGISAAMPSSKLPTSLSTFPSFASLDGQTDAVESVASLEVEKHKRKSYIECLKYFEPFAKLIAEHPHQDMCIGAAEGLKSIISGQQFDSSMGLEQRCQNHLHQFSASRSQNLFGGSYNSFSSSLETANFSSVASNSKISTKTSKKRLKPAVELRQDKKSGKPQSLHLAGRTNSNQSTCSFCQDIQSHGNRSRCEKYNNLKVFEVQSTQRHLFMQDLGDGSLHKLLQCPPEVERIISQREKSDKKVEPWPMVASHMILKNAYFDFGVVFTKTRYASVPVTESAKNIVGVQFLSTIGADPITNSGTEGCIFYYRAREVRQLIASKMKGKRLLFDCIERSSLLGGMH